jgi:hypothetical protein
MVATTNFTVTPLQSANWPAVRAPPATGYCPNHATGVTLPADFNVTPLQYVD